MAYVFTRNTCQRILKYSKRNHHNSGDFIRITVNGRGRAKFQSANSKHSFNENTLELFSSVTFGYY